MKLGARSPLPFPRGLGGGTICTPIIQENILRVFICGQMSSAISHRLACGWICSMWCRVIFFKNVRFSLADCYGPANGPWVVWHWFCSHTYGVNGGLALCSHAQTRHAKLWTFNFAKTFFHLASDNHWLLRKHSIGQTPIVPSSLSHMGD